MAVGDAIARTGIIAAFLLSGASLLPAQSAISTLPDSVIAGRSGSAPVLLIVRNSTTKSWTRVRFACMPAGQVACRLDRRLPASVAPGAAVSRHLTVTDPLGTAAPGVVVLRLDYLAADTVAVATATVKLAAGRFPRPEEAAKVELAGSLVSLTERDSASVYLSVRNLTDTAMTVLPPVIRAPRYLKPSADSMGVSVTVARGNTAMIPVIVRSGDQVQPGKATLVFVVPIRWWSGPRALEGDVVLSKELDIGVTGLSDILKLLGVPSVLFLPGALVLLTLTVLWRVFPPPGRGKSEFPFQPVSGEFLVLSVTISLVGIVLGRRWGGQDYLRFYGLQDVFRLWMMSIVLGATFYLLVIAIRTALDRRARRMGQRMNLADTDDAVVALEKVARGGEKSLLRQVVYVDGAKDKELVVLGRDPADAKSVFLAPKVQAQLDESSDEFKQLNELLTADKAKETAEYLRTLVDAGKATVDWADGIGVRREPAEKLKPVGKERWVML